MDLTLTFQELFKLRPTTILSNEIMYRGPNGVGVCNEILFNSCSLVLKIPCTVCKMRNVNNQKVILNLDEATEINLRKFMSVIENVFGKELCSLVTRKSNKRPRVLSPKLTMADTKYDTRVVMNGIELDVENWATIEGSSAIAYIRFVGLYKRGNNSSIVIELSRLFLNMEISIPEQIIDPENVCITITDTMTKNTLIDCLSLNLKSQNSIEQISITRLVAVNNCICHIVNDSGQEIIEKFQTRSIEPNGYVYLLLRLDGSVDAGVLSKQTNLKDWYKENVGTLVRLLYPIGNILIVEKVYLGMLEKKYKMKHIELCSMIHDFVRVYSVLH